MNMKTDTLHPVRASAGGNWLSNCVVISWNAGLLKALCGQGVPSTSATAISMLNYTL